MILKRAMYLSALKIFFRSFGNGFIPIGIFFFANWFPMLLMPIPS